MNPICRKSSKGAKRERRLGAYRGAIGDVPCALLLQLTHVWAPGALNGAQPPALLSVVISGENVCLGYHQGRLILTLKGQRFTDLFKHTTTP